DGGQDERDRVAGDRHAVTELAHERFGRVGERFQARQAEKTTGALDRVDEAKNVVEDLGVVGILLESDEFHVDDVEGLVRLGEEFLREIINGMSLCRQVMATRAAPSRSGASVL